MWRQRSFRSEQDADESISDEDELDQVTYDYSCSKNLQCLCPTWKKPPVTSQAESLGEKEQHPIFGDHEANLRQRSSPSSLEKLENFSSEYEIGMHELKNENVNFIQCLSSKKHRGESGEESISDEENAALSKLSSTAADAEIQRSYYKSFESENLEESSTWSAVVKDANNLACLQRKSSSSSFNSNISEVREYHRGGRGKEKLKFSFRLRHKEDYIWACATDGNRKSHHKEVEGLMVHNNHERRTVGGSMSELLGNIQEENEELCPELLLQERDAEPSMSELLEDLQKKNDPSSGAQELLLQNVKAKERKTQFVGRRALSHLGSRNLDNDDPLELTGDGSSGDDEATDQKNLSLAIQRHRGHTMADLFQEAFSTSASDGSLFPIHKQSRVGYHGRLQQVLQSEKDRQLGFLKELQSEGSSLDESSSIDARIVSRFLEAKLIVCRCLFGAKTNSSQYKNEGQEFASDEETVRTVIFSSKICDNVELEVGNMVRIHPPWKEVQVNDDETIILCMYFS